MITVYIVKSRVLSVASCTVHFRFIGVGKGGQMPPTFLELYTNCRIVAPNCCAGQWHNYSTDKLDEIEIAKNKCMNGLF